MSIKNNTLIYDIETKTFGKPDSSRDRFKFFGCYSYMKNKSYLLSALDNVQFVIDKHKYLVGFNNEGTKFNPGYDNPILKREGIKFNYKIFIDLRKIFKERASQMKIEKGMLGDLIMEYSLDYITRLLGLVDEEQAKLKIDYDLFKKILWTKEEFKEIEEYTLRDIEVTKKLYEWVEDYFGVFKDFLRQDDIDKKAYLTVSTAKLSYKAICKAMGWKEEYTLEVFEDESIGGGYVSYPAGESFEGKIFCLDFNSLYPHIVSQCNLYGRKKPEDNNDRPMWSGSNKWKVDGIYYSDKMSGVGKLLMDWYADRVEMKKVGDRKEYTIKIILNTIYGILNNGYYKRTYDRVAGGDCTKIGRQWVKYCRKIFTDKGYDVIYSDTDSVYIIDKFNDEKKMLAVKDKIIKDIKDSVPFPQDTFDMGIDDRIKYMFFFKGKNKEDKKTDIEMDELDYLNKPKGLMKKNYIYVTTDGKVIIKNLGIKKKSNSALSRKIFWDCLVPQIKTGKIKFSKKYIKDVIFKFLENDVSLAQMRKEVGKLQDYKSKTCLAAQISQKYGSGIHFLIPNNKNIGVGKGKKFCTREQFKKYNMTINDIDLSNVWMELDHFLIKTKTKNIFEFDEVTSKT